MATRHSGIQKQVLSLYRESLRAARRIPTPSGAAAAAAFARAEFRRGALTVDRMDFQRVEHLLRAARKQLDTFSRASDFALVVPPRT
jgi:succinate dehydrogenase assembly factor 1